MYVLLFDQVPIIKHILFTCNISMVAGTQEHLHQAGLVYSSLKKFLPSFCFYMSMHLSIIALLLFCVLYLSFSHIA